MFSSMAEKRDLMDIAPLGGMCFNTSVITMESSRRAARVSALSSPSPVLFLTAAGTGPGGARGLPKLPVP